jgi:hypothetical protein
MREKTALIKIVNNMLKHKTMMPSADKITSILSKYDIEEIQLSLECTLKLLYEDAELEHRIQPIKEIADTISSLAHFSQ